MIKPIKAIDYFHFIGRIEAFFRELAGPGNVAQDIGT